MLGSSVIHTVSIASCCVLAMVEASKPIPRLDSRNRPESSKISPKSPRMGTLNHQAPIARTSSVLRKARIT
jgi:hypothetical protein